MGEANRQADFYVAPVEPPPSRRAPITTVGLLGWLRTNLFSNVPNTIATICTLGLVGVLLWEIFDWSIYEAQWGVVFNNLRQITSGKYALQRYRDEIWRIELTAAILVFLTGLGLGVWSRVVRWTFVAVLVILGVVLFIPVLGARVPEPSTYLLVQPRKTPKNFLFVGQQDQKIIFSVDPLNDPADADKTLIGYLEKQSRTEWSTQSRAARIYQERVGTEAEAVASGSIPPTQAIFSPNGQNVLLSGSADGTLILWDVTEREAIRRFAPTDTGWTYGLGFSPDNRTAISGTADGPLVLWEVAQGKETARFEGHAGPVYSVTYSADGNTILSGSADGALILWNARTGEAIRRFESNSGPVYDVALSSDGSAAIAGSTGGTLILWDVATGEEVRRFDGHTDDVLSVAFAQDGSSVLSGSADDTLILWDVATGEELQRFAGHTDDVLSVALSRNGRNALSGSADDTLILWNVATGDEVRRFTGHTDDVLSVAFTRDGNTALSGSADRSMALWNVTTGDLRHQYQGYLDDVGNDVLLLPELDLTEYNLTITVRLLDERNEVLTVDGERAEFTLDPGDDTRELTVTLPADNWYILEIERDDEANGNVMNNRGYAWIEIGGVELFSSQEGPTQAREEEFGEPPVLCSDSSVRCAQERDYRFEGARTIEEFISLQISPFFNRIAVPFFGGILLFFNGWVIGILGKHEKIVRRSAAAGWLLCGPFILVILYGFEGSRILPRVPISVWGGLLLTMLLTIVGIGASFPLGVALALGRRSELPVVKWTCTVFIETVRGVPLITILFMAKHIVPYFWSALADPNLMIPRMMVGLTLFSAAYLAENVRGGLQIVPHGQIEAARALGMNPFLTTALIVLPQALRAVIPAIVGQFISLFKDTSLVAALFVFDLVGMVQNIVTTDLYRPYKREAYIFIAIVYFVISYVMSDVSRRLETSGAGSVRKIA